MTQTLYRFWDADGVLLYVGISVRPWQRWREHRGDKPWWEEVVSVTLESFATREEVAAAEAIAIRSEGPRHNIAGRGAVVEIEEAPDWSGVHAPQIAYIGDLFWCPCREPDWDSAPSHPVSPFDEDAYREMTREWVATQPFYAPDEFAQHVIAEALGEHFTTRVR